MGNGLGGQEGDIKTLPPSSRPGEVINVVRLEGVTTDGEGRRGREEDEEDEEEALKRSV